MSTTRGIVTLIAAVVASHPACSGEKEASERTPEAASEQATPAVRDACTLITKAEADSILGVAVTPEQRESDLGKSMCLYNAEPNPGFILEVTWSGGREALDLEKTAHPLAGGLMKEGGMHAPTVDAITALEPVEGIGDEAYFNLLSSYVRKGDVLLEFMLNELSQTHISTGHTDAPAGLKEQWSALARKALARL